MLESKELRDFALSIGINSIGWFKSCDFPGYLKAIEKRREYHKFNYRSHQDFLNAGRLNEKAKTIIVLVVDYFYENKYESNGFKISNYSRFCWNTLTPKSNKIIQFLKEKNVNARSIDLPARASACKAGLGYIGKNCMFYAHGLGSYVGISTISTELELPMDDSGQEQIQNPKCKDCNKCIDACPTQAISPDGYCINPFKCISFINRHPDEPHKKLPEDKSKFGRWLLGCETCQDVCPLNKNIEHKKEVVFSRELNLYGMKIENKSTISEEFLRSNMKYITLEPYKEFVCKLLEKGDASTF